MISLNSLTLCPPMIRGKPYVRNIACVDSLACALQKVYNYYDKGWKKFGSASDA